jgi:hypothetical protein
VVALLKAVVVEAVAQDPDIYQKSPASADTAGAMALDGIITQYRMACKLGDGGTARQTISLLVYVNEGGQKGGIKDAKLTQLMSECTLEADDIVKIIRAKVAGSSWGLGVIESVEYSTAIAKVREIKPLWLEQFCKSNKTALHLSKYEAGKPDLRDPCEELQSEQS